MSAAKKPRPVTRVTVADRLVEDLLRPFVRETDPRTAPVTWDELVALRGARQLRSDVLRTWDVRDFEAELAKLLEVLAWQEQQRRENFARLAAVIGENDQTSGNVEDTTREPPRLDATHLSPGGGSEEPGPERATS